MRIGVDTGGTSSDCATVKNGEIKILKVFSTRENAARAIVDGVSQMLDGRQPTEFDVIHGTHRR